MSHEGGGFNEEEIQNLQDIFNLFDKEQRGLIQVSDLEQIMESLKRDVNEAKEILQKKEMEHVETLNFDEFIDIMQLIE